MKAPSLEKSPSWTGGSGEGGRDGRRRAWCPGMADWQALEFQQHRQAASMHVPESQQVPGILSPECVPGCPHVISGVSSLSQFNALISLLSCLLDISKFISNIFDFYFHVSKIIFKEFNSVLYKLYKRNLMHLPNCIHYSLCHCEFSFAAIASITSNFLGQIYAELNFIKTIIYKISNKLYSVKFYHYQFYFEDIIPSNKIHYDQGQRSIVYISFSTNLLQNYL